VFAKLQISRRISIEVTKMREVRDETFGADRRSCRGKDGQMWRS